MARENTITTKIAKNTKAVLKRHKTFAYLRVLCGLTKSLVKNLHRQGREGSQSTGTALLQNFVVFVPFVVKKRPRTFSVITTEPGAS